MGVEQICSQFCFHLSWGKFYSLDQKHIFLQQAANAGIKTAEYRAYASGQIGYMLGDNPKDFSYLVGYGDNFPKQPHHKVNFSKFCIYEWHEN